MLYTPDTIAAIATAPGRGGVGVIRVSGKNLQALISGLLGREQSALKPRFVLDLKALPFGLRFFQTGHCPAAFRRRLAAQRSLVQQDKLTVFGTFAPRAVGGGYLAGFHPVEDR